MAEYDSVHAALGEVLTVLEEKNPGNVELVKVRVQLAVSRANVDHVQAALVRMIQAASFDADTQQMLIEIITAVKKGKP